MKRELLDAAEHFVRWLDSQVTAAGRGSDVDSLDVAPEGRFWLGRLAPEEAVVERGLGDRGERLDPCAMGMRLLVSPGSPWSFSATVRLCVWRRESDDRWEKSEALTCSVPVQLKASTVGEFEFGREILTKGLAEVALAGGMSAVLRVEIRPTATLAPEFAISIVNTSPAGHETLVDTNLYEVALAVEGLDTTPFTLEALPDSFRYDRKVAAYGINCGVERDGGVFTTTDTVVAERGRNEYWNVESPPPDLRFATLSADPLPSLRDLVTAVEVWAKEGWSEESLASRAVDEGWDEAMRDHASKEATKFYAELDRLEEGLHALEHSESLRRAFQLMNDAMDHAAQGNYDGWRPFQMGFLLANLRCLIDSERENEIADIIWFATGGGKTETYLGLLVAAALLDRLEGRMVGVTAWSRFPLRMLSLQQTQRFANAMAGAELVRRRESIPGEPFSVGFFVGQAGTPNRIPAEPRGERGPDPDDDAMPGRYQVLTSCPFCHADSVFMAFDRVTWCLEHRCGNDACPWGDERLPFYIVDDEIYRFLPTVIVGTLDKAALIAFQASMGGFVGPPWGVCSRQGHGFTYASRTARPNGCLVPGCPGTTQEFPGDPDDVAPKFRLQDELHLLRDSLGAVDAHYESLLDHLQEALGGQKPKILASSATLTGYEHQVNVLYNREARVFPLPGPSPTQSFWTKETPRLARRFVAIAPRGQTLEFTIDKILTELQRSVRRLRDEPVDVCAEAGIDPEYASELLSLYGTDVVYGNTIRDLDASLRSVDTQVNVDGSLNTGQLTGRTPFDDVRNVLGRLENPEAAFDDRLHVIGASSMMSHGVDIDRLNVMVMLGLPLSTSEFIQSTARIGRRWPGLAYVITKIARERDAALFRSFRSFVEQGDRFVDAVPVTRRSRRVLERTLPGIELARILNIHERRARKPLTTVKALRDFCESRGIDADGELDEIVNGIGLGGPLDTALVDDVESWLDEFFHNLREPLGDMRFPSDLCPRGGRPMQSLRDVEEQAPVTGVLPT